MDSSGGVWSLPTAVEVLPAYDYASLLYTSSGGIWLPSDTPSEKPDNLRTFSAVELLRVPDDHGKQHLLDALCYAGGVVWKLDWLPSLPSSPDSDPSAAGPSAAAAAGAHRTEYFAAAIHPKGCETNKVNQAQSGPGCVQIWALPCCTDSGSSSPDAQPRCVYSIIHQGRVAWDIKWLPVTPRCQHHQQQPPQQQQHNVLGVLAMLLGDGTICITACPDPGQVDTLAPTSPAATAATAAAAAAATPAPPAALHIQPLYTLNEGVATGSLPSCCEWLPRAPHNKLLVGCWDGTAMAWQFPLTDGVMEVGQPPRLLYHIRVDPLALRSVRWPPAAPFACGDECGAHMFAAVGHGGRVHMMDPRTPVQPAFTKILNRTSWVLDMAWAGSPHCLAAALEDGELRLLPLAPSYLALLKDQLVFVLKGNSNSSVWSVSYSPSAKVLALCGDEGVVGLQHLELNLDQRYRRPQAVLGGLQRGADGAVRVSNLPDYVNTAGGTSVVSQGGAYYRQRYSELREELPGGRGFADEQQCLYCVRFSPHVVGGSQWVVYGGAGGFIRMQKLSFHVRGV